jgi:enoyl-CoA hydratase/carnithine racemase
MSVTIERRPERWTIAIDRPQKANALSSEAVEALIAAVEEAEAAAVPVLVFQGHGGNFSAGFDFSGYEDEGEGELLRRFVRIETLLQAVARSSAITVALAHGRNFGAGVDLVAACRWRIAAPEATFRMPGLAFGLVLGTRRFAAIVGPDRARELLEGLATFDAPRALEIGFLRRVAAPGQWSDVIAQAAATARAMPAAGRHALYRVLDAGSGDADLADLVRSAAAPGLKQRMRDYLASQRKAATARAAD